MPECSGCPQRFIKLADCSNDLSVFLSDLLRVQDSWTDFAEGAGYVAIG